MLKSCLVLLLLNVAFSARATLPPDLAQAFAKAHIASDSVAIYVVPVNGGPALIRHNADTAMTSASVMKLLTTYTALERLGPAKTWATEVYADGEVKDGVLNGPLVLKGYGDPGLSLERFLLLVQQIRAKGIRDIRGGLLLDQSYFTVPAPAKEQGPLDWVWEVIPQALLVNLQAERLTFSHSDGGVTVSAEPNLGWTIINQMKIDADSPCVKDVEDAWWPQMQWPTSADGATIATVSGKYPAACSSNTLNLGLTDDRYYVGTLFRQLWQQSGGTLQGPVAHGQASPGRIPLLSVDSPALSRLIMDMNKFSSNAMARLIYLSLGQYQPTPGLDTPSNAEHTIRALLQEKQLQFPELQLDTGCGLSPDERLSAQHWGELLQTAAHSRYAAEFTASLPILGVDGTMSKHLVNEAETGWGHFKTGTLNGVRAMAGYLTTAQGQQLAVVAIVNGTGAEQSWPMFELLLRDLYTAPAITGP